MFSTTSGSSREIRTDREDYQQNNLSLALLYSFPSLVRCSYRIYAGIATENGLLRLRKQRLFIASGGLTLVFRIGHFRQQLSDFHSDGCREGHADARS